MEVFRRLYFKRRLTSGEYESTWQRIPNKYIKKFGSITRSIEDVRPNFYKYSGMKFVLVNNDGFFSDETQQDSFFYGSLGIHRTLVKVEGGYIDTDDTEYPTTPILFIGIIAGDDTKYKHNNEVEFNVDHISKIFDEFPADRVAGLGSTQTASDIIGVIRDHTDGNAVAIFQKYITSGAWNITATSNNYNMATSTSLQGMSTWQLMQKLAEAENMIVYIDNNASLYFKEKTGVPASTTFHLSGIGDNDRTWGHTVMRNIEIDRGLEKVYNRVRIKYSPDDTTTSYYIYNETWNWGDSSSSFRFGVRQYEYINEWMGSTVAAIVAASIFTEFSEPKDLVTLDCKFMPQLELMNRVSLTYQSLLLAGGDMWGYFNWDDGLWGGVQAYNINIANDEYKVVEIKHNIDNFVSTLKIKEL